MSQLPSWSEYMSQESCWEQSRVDNDSGVEDARSDKLLSGLQEELFTAKNTSLSQSRCRRVETASYAKVQTDQSYRRAENGRSSPNLRQRSKWGSLQERDALQFEAADLDQILSKDGSGRGYGSFKSRIPGEQSLRYGSQTQGTRKSSSLPSASSCWDKIRQSRSASRVSESSSFPPSQKKALKQVTFSQTVFEEDRSQRPLANESQLEYSQSESFFLPTRQPTPDIFHERSVPPSRPLVQEGKSEVSASWSLLKQRKQGASRSTDLPPQNIRVQEVSSGILSGALEKLQGTATSQDECGRAVRTSQEVEALLKGREMDQGSRPSGSNQLQKLAGTNLPAVSSPGLKLESYLEMFVALTGCEASREVQFISGLDENRFKVKDLQQILSAHMLAPGTRSKRETLDRMVGLQLCSPFFFSDGAVTEQPPSCPSVAELQNDLSSLGWLEGDVSEVEHLCDSVGLVCNGSSAVGIAGKSSERLTSQVDRWTGPEESLDRAGQAAVVSGHKTSTSNVEQPTTAAFQLDTSSLPAKLLPGPVDWAQNSTLTVENLPAQPPGSEHRAPFSQQQIEMLESALAFVGPHHRPSKEAFSALAKRTRLLPSLVETWFDRKMVRPADAEAAERPRKDPSVERVPEEEGFLEERNNELQNAEASLSVSALAEACPTERPIAKVFPVQTEVEALVDANVSSNRTSRKDVGCTKASEGNKRPNEEMQPNSLTPSHEAFLAGAFALCPSDGDLPRATCRSLAQRIRVNEEAVSSFFETFKASRKEKQPAREQAEASSAQGRGQVQIHSSCPSPKPLEPDLDVLKIVEEAERSLRSGKLPPSIITVLEDIKRFEEHHGRTAGAQEILTGKGRIGRKIAGVLMEDYKSPNKDGTMDILKAGVHVGTIIRPGGSSHDADLCEHRCKDTHDFYLIRFVCSESPRQRTKLRACLDLKIDLHERLRLHSWTDLRKMSLRNPDALPDAWLLLAHKTPLPPPRPTLANESAPNGRVREASAVAEGATSASKTPLCAPEKIDARVGAPASAELAEKARQLPDARAQPLIAPSARAASSASAAVRLQDLHLDEHTRASEPAATSGGQQKVKDSLSETGETEGKGKKSQTVKRNSTSALVDPFAFLQQTSQAAVTKEDEQVADLLEPVAPGASRFAAAEAIPSVSSLLLAQTNGDHKGESQSRLTESYQNASEVNAADAMVDDIVTQLGVGSTESETQRQFVPGSPPPVSEKGWRSVIRSPGFERSVLKAQEKGSRLFARSQERGAQSVGGVQQKALQSVQEWESVFEERTASEEPVITSPKSPHQSPGENRITGAQLLTQGRTMVREDVSNQGKKRKSASGLGFDRPDGWAGRRLRTAVSGKKADEGLPEGEVVWSRSGGSWWPAQVISPSSLTDGERQKLPTDALSNKLLVRLFGTQPLVSAVQPSKTLPFEEHVKRLSSGRHSSDFHTSVRLATEAGLGLKRHKK